jgi:hypothetical protein
MTKNAASHRHEFTSPVVREISRTQPATEPPPDRGDLVAQQRRLVTASLLANPADRR